MWAEVRRVETGGAGVAGIHGDDCRGRLRVMTFTSWAPRPILRSCHCGSAKVR